MNARSNRSVSDGATAVVDSAMTVTVPDGSLRALSRALPHEQLHDDEPSRRLQECHAVRIRPDPPTGLPVPTLSAA
jgi:hypothetical protein